MSEMIPDRMPARASKGEKRLFAILQNLPDDYIVYYEPVIENRYPDFIIIGPDFGLMLVEVKGWYPKNILKADSHEVTIQETRGPEVTRHPVRQAREYMHQLMDALRQLPGGTHLMQADGGHQGKFTFPFGYLAILSNITQDQLDGLGEGKFSAVFPPRRVATRDQLLDWEERDLDGVRLSEELRRYFDPYWDFDSLTDAQVSALRAAIHPEVVIPPAASSLPLPEKSPAQQLDIKTLDLRQERNVRNIGDGHRIIYGVAGSGKTIMLIAKARLQAEQQPDAPVLVLCFNVTLATYLQGALQAFANVTVTHFDGWAKINGVTRQRSEDNASLGARLLDRLESGSASHSHHFNSILIDEAQDFDPSWFQCALAAMEDPLDGDLIIVGDGSQGLYGNRQIRWKQLGIRASGRTISRRFDLDKNYRNSREILELASEFASFTGPGEEEETIVALKVDSSKCLRQTGIKPRLVRASHRMDELQTVVGTVKDLLDGRWNGTEITPLQPNEIAIFYPYATQRDRKLMEALKVSLSDLAPVVWLNQDSLSRKKVTEPGIKIQTIHSSKGLQYKAVIVMWADLLPRPFEDTSLEEERKLMYVALTRAEDYLLISASGNSVFVDEIASAEAIR